MNRNIRVRCAPLGSCCIPLQNQDAEIKPFCGLYQKILLLPRPDYASRFCKYTLFISIYLFIKALKSLVQRVCRFLRNCVGYLGN